MNQPKPSLRKQLAEARKIADDWQAKYFILQRERKVITDDLSRAHADTEMAQSQAKKAEEDLKVVFEDSNRIIDQLNEQKRETARVSEERDGLVKKIDELISPLHWHEGCFYSSGWDQIVKEIRKRQLPTQPPPRTKWCPADKWFLGLPVLVIALGFYYVHHSKPKPVPVNSVDWEQMFKNEVAYYNDCHSYAIDIRDKYRACLSDRDNFKNALDECGMRTR